MKLIKEVWGNILIVLCVILILIMQLVRFVYPDPLTIENVFSWSNIKETLLAIFLVSIIVGPIYYLWSMKPKYGEQKEELKNHKKKNNEK